MCIIHLGPQWITPLDLYNSSDHTQPHPIIAKTSFCVTSFVLETLQ